MKKGNTTMSFKVGQDEQKVDDPQREIVKLKMMVDSVELYEKVEIFWNDSEGLVNLCQTRRIGSQTHVRQFSIQQDKLQSMWRLGGDLFGDQYDKGSDQRIQW